MDSHKAVGLVWTSCEDITKLPKNNLEATLTILKSEESLLCDALDEIDEEVRNDASAQYLGEDIDNTEVWNNQDRELLSPCVGLVKTARTCLKKVISAVTSNGDCSTETNCSQLDNLTYIVVELSPSVDNFVTTIYPPVDRKHVRAAAVGVVNIIQNLLKQVQKQHFIKEEDHKWVSFLLNAVDHNNNRLQPLLRPEFDE